MFDVIYITWGVHVAAALLTAKAWYIYWVVRLSFPSLAQTPRLCYGSSGLLLLRGWSETLIDPLSPADPALRPLPPRHRLPPDPPLPRRLSRRLDRGRRCRRSGRERAAEQAAGEAAQADGEGRPARAAADAVRFERRLAGGGGGRLYQHRKTRASLTT